MPPERATFNWDPEWDDYVEELQRRREREAMDSSYLAEARALGEYKGFVGGTPRHLRDLPAEEVQLKPNGLPPIPEGEW